MAPIRVVVITVSPILVDLVSTLLSGRALLEIVARFDSHDELETRITAVSPDLVLYGLQNDESDDVARRMLALVPQSKIIVFSSDCRHAYVHSMRPHRKALLNLSPHSLVHAILGAPHVGKI